MMAQNISKTENDILVTRMPKVSLKEFCAEPNELRETFLVSPEDVIFAKNIRPFDEEFVNDLSDSIRKHGQLQECIGDVVVDEEGRLKARIIAGQHRGRSILKINSENGIEGPIVPIRISLYNHRLDPEEVIQIQMSENLQNKMTPEQDAEIIYNYWKELESIREERGEEVTITEIARSIGRSKSKVQAAITYIKGVEPRVREMVRSKKLPYTYALLLAHLPVEGGFMETQLELAQLFWREKFPYKKAKEYANGKRNEVNSAGPLFNGWEDEKITQFVFSLKQKANKEATEVMSWFVRTVKWLEEHGDESKKVQFSKALKKAMKELGISEKNFKKNLLPLISENQYKKLFVK